MNSIATDYQPSARLIRWLWGLVLGGGAALALGLVISPQMALSSLLASGYTLLCAGLAGIFFVAAQYASGAAWAVAFRRVPEAMCAALPVGALIVGVTLLAGSELYPWVHDRHHITGFKAMWLDFPFFLGRAVFYLLLWWAFARKILATSRAQDANPDPALSQRNTRLSVIFLVLFAITFWLASFDWIMSLEPHWYSTIFGIYNFAGMFSSGIAIIILLVLWMRRAGPLRDFVTDEHFHDLGKLLFGFSSFWMYIWFSQYMLIWYANITEETVRYIHLQHRYWLPLFILNVILNWVFPFLALLNKRVKRTGHLLARVAVVVLVGRWLDVYLMVQPAMGGENPSLAIWDIGAIVAASALFVLLFVRGMRQAPPVPAGDPRLAESLHYHN
ncbi:MAG: hypothetical protein IT170_17970 [Bryobacterales bacterium]|nr:hypothetical protein [Bryobacterales bacterium]